MWFISQKIHKVQIEPCFLLYFMKQFYRLLPDFTTRKWLKMTKRLLTRSELFSASRHLPSKRSNLSRRHFLRTRKGFGRGHDRGIWAGKNMLTHCCSNILWIFISSKIVCIVEIYGDFWKTCCRTKFATHFLS